MKQYTRIGSKAKSCAGYLYNLYKLVQKTWLGRTGKASPPTDVRIANPERMDQ
jgi:hypothetical protein